MATIGPSNGWELETRRILQEQLPEYDIDPHIRLSNVVKGRIKSIRAMSQYEIDFTIRNKKTGEVICAIELDGPTHDTQDGKRKDANKNHWMAEAKIPLIRIRRPEDANGIRKKIEEYEFPIFDDYADGLVRKSHREKTIMASIGFALFMGIVLYFGVQLIFKKMGSNVVEKQKQMQLELQERAAAQKAQQSQTAPPQAAAIKPAEQQVPLDGLPRYEKILVKGKSVRECKNSRGQIDNNSIICMKDHYETVLVNAPQN